MKKSLFTLASIIALSGSGAAAADFSSVTLTEIDGNRSVFAAKGLKMRPDGDNLTVTDIDGNTTVMPLDRLATLGFGNDPTLSIPALDTADSRLTIYSLQGYRVGSYASAAEARAALGKGIYIAKTDCTTSKFIVR